MVGSRYRWCAAVDPDRRAATRLRLCDHNRDDRSRCPRRQCDVRVEVDLRGTRQRPSDGAYQSDWLAHELRLRRCEHRHDHLGSSHDGDHRWWVVLHLDLLGWNEGGDFTVSGGEGGGPRGSPALDDRARPRWWQWSHHHPVGRCIRCGRCCAVSRRRARVHDLRSGGPNVDDDRDWKRWHPKGGQRSCRRRQSSRRPIHRDRR